MRVARTWSRLSVALRPLPFGAADIKECPLRLGGVGRHWGPLGWLHEKAPTLRARILFNFATPEFCETPHYINRKITGSPPVHGVTFSQIVRLIGL